MSVSFVKLSNPKSTIFLNDSRPRSPDCSKILIDLPISSEIPQLNPCDLAERFTVVSIS